jgi:hypothetical protein
MYVTLIQHVHVTLIQHVHVTLIQHAAVIGVATVPGGPAFQHICFSACVTACWLGDPLPVSMAAVLCVRACFVLLYLKGGASSYNSQPLAGWLWWAYNENSMDT